MDWIWLKSEFHMFEKFQFHYIMSSGKSGFFLQSTAQSFLTNIFIISMMLRRKTELKKTSIFMCSPPVNDGAGFIPKSAGSQSLCFTITHQLPFYLLQTPFVLENPFFTETVEGRMSPSACAEGDTVMSKESFQVSHDIFQCTYVESFQFFSSMLEIKIP